MPSSRFLENYSFLTVPVPVPVPVFGGGWGLPQIGGKFRPGALAALALAARNAAGSGLICPGWRALLACVVCAVRFDGGAGAFAPRPHTRARTVEGLRPLQCQCQCQKSKKKPQPIKTAGVIGQVSKSIRQNMSETAKA